MVREKHLEGARECLRSKDFDLLFVDQRLKDQNGEQRHGGTELIAELKSGELGPLNREVLFVFVTGSETWIEKGKVDNVPGYLGIEVKGRDLGRQLRKRVTEVAEILAEGDDGLTLRRAPLVIVAVEGGPNPLVRSIVPAWDTECEVCLPLSAFPEEERTNPEALLERWFFARINFSEPNPEKLVVRDLEAAEMPDEDQWTGQS